MRRIQWHKLCRSFEHLRLEKKHCSSERASGAPSAPPIVILIIPQLLQGRLLSGLEQPPTQNTSYQPRQFEFAVDDFTPSGSEPSMSAQPTMFTPNMEQHIDYIFADQSLWTFNTLDEIPPIGSSSNQSRHCRRYSAKESRANMYEVQTA